MGLFTILPKRTFMGMFVATYTYICIYIYYIIYIIYYIYYIYYIYIYIYAYMSYSKIGHVDGRTGWIYLAERIR